MKKIYFIIILAFSITLLPSCGLRERILAPPTETEIPEGSLVAKCTVEEDEYIHIYKGDGIYYYFINDVLQGDEALNIIQEYAYLHGESIENYLEYNYDNDQCIIDDYSEQYDYLFD